METGVQPAQSAGEDVLPRSFGRYVLFDHIGRGGMADIYLARMRTSLGGGRNVVVKQILAKLGDDPAFRAMLTTEAKLAAHLNHANVVQVFDFGEEGDRLFIAMDYVEGFDLAQMLKRLSKGKIPFPAEFAILVVREVLRALDYAHRAKDDRGASLGIVHRDVSPSNVLVSFEGEVKLCDFGIARALDREGDEGAMRRARVAGKSAYMAPEHARGDRVDARSDLFAAGILLWELCAGRRLYRGDDEQMLALARAAEVPPLPNRNLPDAAGLQAVLDRALASSPDARYPSCAAFLEALETWAIGAKLMASPLRFGAFLTEHFAEDIVSLRRAREKAAAEIVDDADPSTFGPSSAPPPPNGARAVSAPKPPKVPKDWMPPPPDELPYARTEELDALPPPPPPPKVAALSKSGPQKPKGDASETTASGAHKVPALSKSGAAKLAELTKSDAARAAKVDAVKAKGEPPASSTPSVASSSTSSSSAVVASSSGAPSTLVSSTPVSSMTPSVTPVSSATPSVTPVSVPTPSVTPIAHATPSVTPISSSTPQTSSSGPRSISVDLALDSSALATPSARVSSAKAPGAFEAFSPAWLALVVSGAVAFGVVVYFVVSALAR